MYLGKIFAFKLYLTMLPIAEFNVYPVTDKGKIWRFGLMTLTGVKLN